MSEAKEQALTTPLFGTNQDTNTYVKWSTSTEELERALSADASSSAASGSERSAAAAPSVAALTWRLGGLLALLPTEPPDWRSAPPLCCVQNFLSTSSRSRFMC